MVFPRYLPEVYYDVPNVGATSQEVDLTDIETDIRNLRTQVENIDTSSVVGVYDLNGEGDEVQSIAFGTGFEVYAEGGEATIYSYNLEYRGDNSIESVDDSSAITFIGAEISRDSSGIIVNIKKDSASGRRGELFYSLFKDSNPNKLYQGETYNVSDYPEFIDEITTTSAGELANIVKINNETFTIDGLTDFIRGAVNSQDIGKMINDTTAVNGLQIGSAQNSAIFYNQVTNGGNTLYGNQTNAQIPSHTHSITGDTETAPKHTLLYVGIYAN